MNNLQQRIFYIILLENVILSVICVNDVRDNVFNDELIALSDIKHTGNDFIHVALIITNVKNKEEILRRIESNLNKMIKSIFKYSFSTHLHFIIITDENTKGLVKTVFKNNIGLVLSSQIVFITSRRKRPKLKIEFVSLESLTEKYRDKINMIVQFTFLELSFFSAENWSNEGVVQVIFLVDSFKSSRTIFGAQYEMMMMMCTTGGHAP